LVRIGPGQGLKEEDFFRNTAGTLYPFRNIAYLLHRHFPEVNENTSFQWVGVSVAAVNG